MYQRLLNRKLGRAILASIFGAMCLTAPALADDDHHEDHHHAHAHRCMLVQYTPDTEVAFQVNAGDFATGTKTILNHGQLNWWSNTCRWRITTQRTAWAGLPGDGAVTDIHLQIRQGGDENPWADITQGVTPWLTGHSYGYGSYCGVDWQLVDMYEGAASPFGIPPAGEYSTTVTFTIEPTS